LKYLKPTKVVLIGASTGGMGEIDKIITSVATLEKTAIVIAQHMADGFVESFFKKTKKQQVQSEAKIQKENFKDIMPIAKYIQNETGITFDKQIAILKNKVLSFCRHREIYSFEVLLQEVKSTPELKQDLIDKLTTNETYFNREFTQIEELVKLVKKEDKEVKILCAPCATGEEVYSIAIALLEAKIEINKFHIVGIDISQEALNTASIAIYKEKNIRKLSPKVLKRYFTKENSQYILSKELKKPVSFKLANIFDVSFSDLGKFDFVFSRNMLIYFDKETKMKAKTILESVRKDAKHKVFFGHADLF